jgi:hypothetical protein
MVVFFDSKCKGVIAQNFRSALVSVGFFGRSTDEDWYQHIQETTWNNSQLLFLAVTWQLAGNNFFHQAIFDRSDFLTKILTVRILPSKQEKQSGPKIKTSDANQPDILNRKIDNRCFCDKISSHIFLSCGNFVDSAHLGRNFRPKIFFVFFL